MSREYTGHWGRVAATVTHVFAGWDPPEPEVSLTILPNPRCRGVPAAGTPQNRGTVVFLLLKPPKPEVPRCLRRPPALAGPGAARDGCGPPGRPRVGLRQRPPRSPEPAAQRWVSHGADRGQRAAAAGQGRGAGGCAMGRCGAPAAAREEQPQRSPSAAPAPAAPKFSPARGGRRGQRGAAGGAAPPGVPRTPLRRGAVQPAAPTFQHRAEFVRGHCLPAAAAISGAPWPWRCPPRGRCARGYGSAPARPRPCPAPPRGALSLRRPSAEPPPRSVPSRAGRGGLRRGWPAPGGLPAPRSERSPPAPSPTEAAAAK